MKKTKKRGALRGNVANPAFRQEACMLKATVGEKARREKAKVEKKREHPNFDIANKKHAFWEWDREHPNFE